MHFAQMDGTDSYLLKVKSVLFSNKLFAFWYCSIRRYSIHLYWIYVFLFYPDILLVSKHRNVDPSKKKKWFGWFDRGCENMCCITPLRIEASSINWAPKNANTFAHLQRLIYRTFFMRELPFFLCPVVLLTVVNKDHKWIH